MNKKQFFETIGNYQKIDWLFSQLGIIINIILSAVTISIPFITKTIKIIVIVLILVLLIFQVFIRNRKRGRANLNNIKFDGTKIVRFDTNQSTWNEMSEQDYQTWSRSFKKRFVFIALTITNNVNIIQFAILGKLMQLQKTGLIPVIYLSSPITEFNVVEKKRITEVFKRLIRFYLGKRCVIIDINYNKDNKYSIFTWSEIYSFLKSTSFQELKEALSCQNIEIKDETPLHSFFIPILEIFNVYIYYGMKQGIVTLCGESLRSMWKLGCKKIKTMNLPIFIMPSLCDLSGNVVKPQQLNNVLNINWTDCQIVKNNLDNNATLSNLKSIYKFFIFPIIEKNESVLKIKDGNKTYEVANINEIDNVLDEIPISTLTADLTCRVPKVMMEKKIFQWKIKYRSNL